MSTGPNRSTLETLRGLDEELRNFGEIESARMKVVGRIAYFLEKLVLIEDGLASKIALVQKQVNGLEKKLDSGALEDLVDSKLSIIAEWMTSMARELSLEHSETRVRLDRKKLMVIADTRDGPISLSEIGSGHNWMGYHVVTYLAMHRWFCEESRPIPRFAFFDQPSTAFYQNEEGDAENPGDLSQSDRVALQGVFALMFREVARLEGRIQLIVIDHADLPGDDFRGAVVERWRRDGLKLVPDAWLEFVTEEATIDEPLSE